MVDRTAPRKCYRCKATKPADAFTWRKNGTPFSACKECNKIMARERRARVKAGLPAPHPEFHPDPTRDDSSDE